MRVLGIESSCDETGAAVVDETGMVYSDVVASQIALHAPYGGVVPELAARAHMKNVTHVVRAALDAAPGGLEAVDAIAVTQGPGLVGALLVGTSAAKAMAWSLGKPIAFVNHLEGHLLAPFLRRREDEDPGLAFPYVALLASGGHTALYRVDSPMEIELIGQTRDDAAGEAYDKAAKLLGLGYPGGPILDRLARRGDAKASPFAVPMQKKKGLEFSFAGLKTAVARQIERDGIPGDEAELANIAAGFQEAVVRSLVETAIRACREVDVPRLVLTGGVAANSRLRDLATERCDEERIALVIPPFASCTDNAAMIAYAGARRLLDQGGGDLSLAPYSRDPLRKRGRFGADGRLIPRKPPR
jgi:N6-L-threonylcarbamoyladenine synthase